MDYTTKDIGGYSMKLTFIGADHEVTGSCHCLETEHANILVDYGMEQGLNVYENVEVPLSDDWMDEDISYDGILFTCASSVERFLSNENRRNWLFEKRKMDVYAIGPKCRQKLESFGILDTVESSQSTYEAMVHTLLSRHHLTSL